MFFIGIFGIESKEKEIKTFGNVVCPDCGKYTQAVLYESYTYFHIFFIPTFRWNRRYFLRLRCCGAVYEAPADYAKQLKDADSIDFSRLQKVSSGFGGYEDFWAVCPKCGKSFDKSFAYCPYCGTKHK
jgi:DNA-directed RNA polymerase subunit RPC12/RpoP